MLDDRIPAIDIDYAMVLDKALENSSFDIGNQIQMLNAESDIARARAERGASATLNARFGLSQTGEEFRTAYSNLLDQEVVGLQFSIPIFDWGMGKGRVRMARAKAEIVRNRIEQEEIDYRHEIYTLIEQFLNQRNQCAVAGRALEVAERRYSIALENFRRGTVSVTDMNTAQTEKDQANQTYVSALADFWNYYYSLRRKTLYDFISPDRHQRGVRQTHQRITLWTDTSFQHSSAPPCCRAAADRKAKRRTTATTASATGSNTTPSRWTRCGCGVSRAS